MAEPYLCSRCGEMVEHENHAWAMGGIVFCAKASPAQILAYKAFKEEERKKVAEQKAHDERIAQERKDAEKK